MKILRTKVFSKVDRTAAIGVLQADMKRGMPLLFRIADKKGGSVSGCQRLSKVLGSEYRTEQESGCARLSNFSGGYLPLSEVHAETIIDGLGSRFPCDYGWIMSVQKPQAFVDFFTRNSCPVNQNSFLPGVCNVFCFSVFGVIALSVQALNFDNPIAEIDNDEAESPFGCKSWAFMHFILDEEDRTKSARMEYTRSAELKHHLNALKESVKGGRRDGRGEPVGAPRISLRDITKRHFKKLGYVWNKSQSEPRLTVFDKLTERGNVIRVSADAGGFNELIPYVQVRFLNAAFISPAVWVVSVQAVNTEEELESLLTRHHQDVHYYEEHVAAIYDEEMGCCHPAVTKLLQDHRIRRID